VWSAVTFGQFWFTQEDGMKIDSMSRDVKLLKKDMEDVKIKVSNMENDIADLKKDMEDLKTNVSNMENDIADLKTNMDLIMQHMKIGQYAVDDDDDDDEVD
jgi:predicted  nucleic acid-binding Zn-ribbon protein